MTYIVSPYQTWGVFQAANETELWEDVGESSVFFDPFDRDWLKEDENRSAYLHEVTGDPSSSNYYINRFYIVPDRQYAAIELGMTNDFESVNVYINNVLVFS